MKKLIYILPLLFVFLLTGCSDGNEDPTGGKAKVNFYLVDAPGDVDEVWIEILAVRVLMNNSDEENESEWVEILYNETDPFVNLMSLVGENSAFLGSDDLPEGEIKQLRLLLGEGNYVIIDGKRSELKTPSAQQSGLKIKVNELIDGGQVYGLVIDFDVEKSIVLAGNSGNIILKPVLRAYIQEATTGVEGQILPLEAQPIGLKMTGEGQEYNTQVDENGNFKFLGIEDGFYTLEVIPNNSFTAVTFENIEVVEGVVKMLAPTVLELN